MDGISIGNEKMSAFPQYSMLILPLTASSTKDVPDLNEYPFVLDTCSANPMRVLKCT